MTTLPLPTRVSLACHISLRLRTTVVQIKQSVRCVCMCADKKFELSGIELRCIACRFMLALVRSVLTIKVKVHDYRRKSVAKAVDATVNEVFPVRPLTINDGVMAKASDDGKVTASPSIK